ncbi:hypothetical protein [Pseudomonas orientalis]|uniref:hypothetical protein n=1 Tax=Pseudomonas orientalis TaxID=76758 RepID=UPI001022C1C4|nr:hypothetical protein [Pseudomonas orientalis]RZI23126.1 hypothetical protein EUX53_13355 [Pseudomonas orientalis]
MLNKYNQDHFMGKKVKCNMVLSSRLNILEALYVMTYRSAQCFRCPLGFHIRVRFTERMDMRSFSARLTTHYQRNFDYNPLRVTVKEDDPDDDGVHYHIAIVIDGKINKKKSIQHFLAELKTGNFLHDYKVIPPTSNQHGQNLNSRNERDEYLEWMSYLAKTKTKKSQAQSISCCKKTQRDIADWKRKGKQDLSETQPINHQHLRSAPELLQDELGTPLWMLEALGQITPPAALQTLTAAQQRIT